MATLRTRPALAAALIYALLSVLMVAPGLVPGHTLSASDYLYNDAPWTAARPAGVTGLGANFELADADEVFQPFLQYTRSQLPHLPLWNPHISGGRPYLANAQSAIFSPFTWPGYILPFWFSLGVMAALKLFVGAFGAYLLGRRLGMRFGGALVCGLVFAFGTFFVVWLAWPLTNIFPLIPWLLLFADDLARRPGPLPVAGLATFVALSVFGGHPETTFHTLFVTGVFYLLRLVLRLRAGPRADQRRTGLVSLAAFAAGVGLGVALSAIMLIPFAELLVHSGDLARRQGQVAGHWPAKFLLALFLHDYWGRPTQNSNLLPFVQLRAWYAGAVTLMLASVALVVRPVAERIAVALFALLVVCIVVGIPPVFGLVTALPGFSTAHNERMLIDFLLCVALLAGWGLDELSGGAVLSLVRLRAVLAVCAAIFVLPVLYMAGRGTLTSYGLVHALGIAWAFQTPPALPSSLFVYLPTTPQASIIRMSALLEWLPLAGIGLALIVWRLRPLPRLRLPWRLPAVPFVAAVGLLLAADLFRANMGFNPAIPVAHAKVPVTGGIRVLQSERPNRFVGVSTNVSFQPLPSDTAMYFGLYDARGYDYPAEKHYDALWRRYVAPGVSDFAQPIETASATPTSLRALDLLSVRDLLTDPRLPMLHEPGLSVAYRGPDSIVYRNAQALPRVFLAGAQHVVNSDTAAMRAATAPSFDRRHVVVTEHRIAGLPGPAASGRAVGSGTARLVTYAPERVVVTASARRRTMLVLTDIAFPGWQATVDGRAAPIERVDYLLRGVPLPSGNHRVEFHYAPASFRAGWIISVGALMAVLVLVVLGARIGWRSRTGEPRR